MLKSGRTMPNNDDIPALARWLNESAKWFALCHR
jgi:hypothetical protein